MKTITSPDQQHSIVYDDERMAIIRDTGQDPGDPNEPLAWYDGQPIGVAITNEDPGMGAMHGGQIVDLGSDPDAGEVVAGLAATNFHENDATYDYGPPEEGYGEDPPPKEGGG